MHPMVLWLYLGLIFWMLLLGNVWLAAFVHALSWALLVGSTFMLDGWWARRRAQ